MSMERLRQGSLSLIIKRTAVEKAIGKGQHRKEGGVFTTLHIPGDSRRQTKEFQGDTFAKISAEAAELLRKIHSVEELHMCRGI